MSHYDHYPPGCSGVPEDSKRSRLPHFDDTPHSPYRNVKDHQRESLKPKPQSVYTINETVSFSCDNRECPNYDQWWEVLAQVDCRRNLLLLYNDDERNCPLCGQEGTPNDSQKPHILLKDSE